MSNDNIKKVAITGTKQFTDKVAAALLNDKKNIITYPYVEIKGIDVTKYKGQLNPIEQFQWIMFTSSNGISCFFNLLDMLKIDLKRLENIKFAVVGDSTAKMLLTYGFSADFIPTAFYGEVLGREFAELIVNENKQKEIKVLIPRALKGGNKLTKYLEDAGITYFDLPVYDTVADKIIIDKLIKDLPDIDGIAFASMVGVRFLCEQNNVLKNISCNKEIFCIGKETAKALEGYGLTEYKMAKSQTAKGLAELIKRV
jgi:uroporphyrinogen III methyltransferase/synthase